MSKNKYLSKDSICANSKCYMFVNINSSLENAAESICSLRFAQRCRAVNLGKAKRDVRLTVPLSPSKSSRYTVPTTHGSQNVPSTPKKVYSDESRRIRI